MNKLLPCTVFMAILVVCGTVTAWAGTKVQVCHIPPGNPSNFHTITVSKKALSAHLGHGDFPGSCFGNAEALCDDGNACTIDAMDPETETCLVDHPPVDCDDGLLCTTDSCDQANGCQYAPIVCDDGNACTVDACNPFDGLCTSTPIDCGALGVCLPETGQCDFPCAGITCDPIDQCHEAGQCVLPGECVEGAPLADGTACDDGDAGTTNDQCTGGVCAGESPPPVGCPCWSGPQEVVALHRTHQFQDCGLDREEDGVSLISETYTVTGEDPETGDETFCDSTIWTSTQYEEFQWDFNPPHCSSLGAAVDQDFEICDDDVSQLFPEGEGNLTAQEIAACETVLAEAAAILGCSTPDD